MCRRLPSGRIIRYSKGSGQIPFLISSLAAKTNARSSGWTILRVIGRCDIGFARNSENTVEFIRPFGLVSAEVCDVAPHVSDPLSMGQMFLTAAKLGRHLAAANHFEPEYLERPSHCAELVWIAFSHQLAIQ